ncbi:hypothetical protein [Variovorax arabinosiphilus]|uniref:hypothetical protein n=1 Tax=Variovorax arabinosiphilus TaxID=3053498 RepID=UPI00257527B0|nr:MULTISPECIES: hypothetical protein [unclassified Variovorax]MDM0122582.1 hypothetical protein [Variovorax sp. J2L1-78]MDM0130889.1 hypothetical protein [Variovorax sp. J2L1-63]MDM0235345.1 hypothetical protein [Variovorax sp. J2R1-6]
MTRASKFVSLCLLCTGLAAGPADAASLTGWVAPKPKSLAEQRILETLYGGPPRSAPLTGKDAVVRPEFLRKVLGAPSDPITAVPPVVRVHGSTFPSALVLDGIRSAAYLKLEDCTYTAAISISDSELKDLKISGNVGVPVSIETTTFSGGLSVLSGKLTGKLSVKNSSFSKEVYFNDLTVEGNDVDILFDAVRAPQGIRGTFPGRVVITVQASDDVNGLSIISRDPGSRIFLNRMKRGRVFVGTDPRGANISVNSSSLDGLTILLTEGGLVDDGLDWPDPMPPNGEPPDIAVWSSDIATMLIVSPSVGYLTVTDTKFLKSVELRGPLPDIARFAQVDFKSLAFVGATRSPKFTPMVWQGVDFNSLFARKQEEHAGLTAVGLLNAIAFNADAYAAYERYRSSVGDKEGADEVFVERKRRERDLDGNIASKAGSYLSDWLIRFGRAPERSLVALFAFALLGAVVFNIDHMQSTKPKPPKQPSSSGLLRPQRLEPKQTTDYSPVWYSIDTLVPIIDFGVAGAWTPKTPRTTAYLKLHIAAGWLFATFAVAAVSGLIK